jgi:hypothetical protein
MDIESNCKQLETLPIIGDANQHDFVVRVPGSLYQPLLIRPPDGSVERVSPGELDANEVRFVRDLIKFLYPVEKPPEPGQPLIWKGLEVWIKRNLEKREDSFRLSVDTSDWYYPDFLIWIVDQQKRVQTLGFVDPKGLREGVDGGWSDYKIVSTLYMAHVVQKAVTQNGTLEIDGEAWQFRIRGALLSTTDFNTLAGHGKFKINDSQGGTCDPDEKDFEMRRIVFLPRSVTTAAYIGRLLELLVHDSALDEEMARCANLQASGPASPNQAVGDFVGDKISANYRP